MDLNRAELHMIARIPGIGLRNAQRLVDLRRLRQIRYADLLRLRCSMKKISPFIITADYFPSNDAGPSEHLRRAMADAPRQMNLWPELQAA